MEEKQGMLDGFTVLRYAICYKKGGGMEQYLENINRALLQRNNMTIIQLYLADQNHLVYEKIEKIGRGILISNTLTAHSFEYGGIIQNWFTENIITLRIRKLVRDMVFYNPFFPSFIKKVITIKKYKKHGPEPVNAGETVCKILSRYNVNLLIIHSAGMLSSTEIINEAQQKNIPFLIMHHFSNERLKGIGIREQSKISAGVGGVSSKKIPKYIKNKYTSLSDGIDTDFFNRNNAKPLSRVIDSPFIILPARIAEGKGHTDLIRVAYQLKKKNVKLKVVFIGRTDQPEFKIKLEKLIEKYKISNDVVFVGQVTLEEMRDWYADSSVVVLPTHDEGFGRVLIEAQAMEVPVVAYDVGGVSEALVNCKTGYLVKKGDIKGFALRLEELLLSDNKRIAMGKAGMEFVKNQFSFSVFAQRHEEWYLNGINKEVR